MNLDGRVALVTGGLRGIGHATCAELAAAGAVLYAADLAPQADGQACVSETLGRRAHYLQLDVADEAAWLRAIAIIRAGHGRLDMLVANAGIDLVGPVELTALADWRRLMSINLDGVFLATKHCTALLDEAGRTTPAGSSVVNVSSILGLVGFPNTSAYNASKGAVRMFTKATALEFALARRPIRVNSVHPGFVRTPLLDEGMRRAAEAGAGSSSAALIDGLAAQTPNGRVAEASEIAAVIAFLASDGSSYMTGSEVVVDGGWTAQ